MAGALPIGGVGAPPPALEQHHRDARAGALICQQGWPGIGVGFGFRVHEGTLRHARDAGNEDRAHEDPPEREDAMQRGRRAYAGQEAPSGTDYVRSLDVGPNRILRVLWFLISALALMRFALSDSMLRVSPAKPAA